MKTEVKLMYFKPSGKYYSEGSYMTEATHVWSALEEVKAMDKHPGLVNRWDGPILIEHLGVPQLWVQE